MVYDFIQEKDSWHYVDVNEGMEESPRKIKPNMFEWDGLHLTDNCYTKVFKPSVINVLKPIWAKLFE